MTVYISGGCKNGKSSIAEDTCKILAENNPLYYIATMKAFDDEDRSRIARHIQNRDGKGFITIEQETNILECLKNADYINGTFILDSVTALMINELYRSDKAMGNTDYSMQVDKTAAIRVSEELCTLCDKVKNIVFVSDYIYGETDKYSEYTEEFIKALSYVDKAVAKKCDCVVEITLANINILKGNLPE